MGYKIKKNNSITDNQIKNGPNVEEADSFKYAKRGRTIAMLIYLISIVAYSMSELNPNRGHLLSLNQDIFVALLGILIFKCSFFVGHLFDKKH